MNIGVITQYSLYNCWEIPTTNLLLVISSENPEFTDFTDVPGDPSQVLMMMHVLNLKYELLPVSNLGREHRITRDTPIFYGMLLPVKHFDLNEISLTKHGPWNLRCIKNQYLVTQTFTSKAAFKFLLVTTKKNGRNSQKGHKMWTSLAIKLQSCSLALALNLILSYNNILTIVDLVRGSIAFLISL